MRLVTCIAFVVLLAVPNRAQDAPATDLSDALQLLQGASEELVIAPERVADVVTWLQEIRRRYPRVADIHVRGRRSLETAVLFFTPEARERLAGAKIVSDAEFGHRLDGPSGIDALDTLLEAIGAVLQPVGRGANAESWVAHFREDYDVPAVCRRFRALAEIAEAGWNPLMGDGDEIFLSRRGSRALFVFKRGRGGCPSGCIHNHYFYFEVDAERGSVDARGEAVPDFRSARYYLWGVPARFAVSVFADFDELLAASRHAEWWVVLHAAEATGALLTLRGLEHADPQVRARALWHLRGVSGQDFGGDAAGIDAWRSWLEAQDFTW